MSFLQKLQQKRLELQATTTIVTTPTGERYAESRAPMATQPIKLETLEYGFVVDTKPDKVAACILDNFLYLGSQDAVTPDNISVLQLSHILSVGVETPHSFATSTIQTTFIPCLDLPETQLFTEGGVVQLAVNFIEMARLCKGRVLVHCNAGVSRSASVVIAYLMQQQLMSFKAAYNLVKLKRECIQPNAGFILQLKCHEQTM